MPRPSLSRLMGLETEYALRFSPDAGVEHPGNYELFERISDALSELVQTSPGERAGDQRFTENGGAYYYEMLPRAFDGGLLEFSTPECRGPSRLLTWQRAEERLLVRAAARAEAALRAEGRGGELALLKNCRDAEGHIYGAQENYEAEIARGPALWALRACALLALPAVLVTVPVFWLVVGLLFAVGLPLVLAGALVNELRAGVPDDEEPELSNDSIRGPMRSFGTLLMAAEVALLLPLTTPFLLALRAFAFRRIRRGATAFLVSRPALSGTGSLDGGGRFVLSEKGPAIRRPTRWSVLPGDRPIYDFGNLVKLLAAPLTLRGRAFFGLFRSRARLQLGLSDGNMAEAAEFLKLGSTALVLDLAEAGELEDAPRLRRPVAALHAIVDDPSLRAAVRTSAGDRTALELQRWYLERAKRVLDGHAAPSLEALRVVELWEETLRVVGQDPGRLSGRLDWPTKRDLLERGRREGLDPAALKKIDLRYHELGDGYFARLEAAGLAERLTDEAAVERAIHEAPDDSPAQLRAALMKRLRGMDQAIAVAWDRIRVGGRLGGKVIRLDDFRRRDR